MKHDSRYTVIDATADDGKIGRLINHSKRHNNVRPEKMILQGKMHVVIVAKCDIDAGREILYDYQDSNSTLPECVPGCLSCQNEGRAVIVEVSNIDFLTLNSLLINLISRL